MSNDMIPLSAVAIFIRNGASIKQEDGAGGDPITRIETIANREINLNKCGYADVSAEDYENYILDTGDILISHINSTKHLGKCAIYRGEKGNVIHGMNLLCLRPNKDIADPDYVYFMLSSPLFLNQLPKITKNSVNQSSFNVKSFNELQIPLPPLETQKQISAVLEKADQLRKDCKLMEQELNSLAQSVFIDMFGDPVTNPKGWDKAKLDSVTDRIIDCPHTTPKWTESGVLCIRTSNLTKGGWDFSEKRFIDELQYENRTSRSKVVPGDLVLSREGTVGIAAIVPAKARLCLGQRLVQIRVEESFLDNHFLLHQLLFQLEPKRLQRVMSGSTVKHLNMKDIRALPVIVPALKKQVEFKKIIEEINSLIIFSQDQDESLNSNFNALMQKAFKGELNLKTKAA